MCGIKGWWKKKLSSEGRIQSIDALRGLSVLLMIAHHLLYDLTEFLGAPRWIFSNPVIEPLHFIFAGTFILLAGVSSRFSRSNLKRGVQVIGCAIVISAVTWLMDMPIKFGILHFLGFCMIFYALTAKLWSRLPEKAAPIIYTVLFAASFLVLLAVNQDVSDNPNYLWAIGVLYKDFFSADYFPVFPWLFVFLFGAWAGNIIRERRLPERFYSFDMPFFPVVGRLSLIVYMAHQPIIYGITILIGELSGLL